MNIIPYYHNKNCDFPSKYENKTKIRKYVMEEMFSLTICRTYNILYQWYR